MKRIAIYAALLTAVLLVPKETVKLSQLKPVEVVYLYREDGRVVIETDTEDRGVGSTVEKAVADLDATTAGTIFLDTADYLLIKEDTVKYIPQLESYFKKSVRICYAEGDMKLSDAAVYLASHKPSKRLGDWGEHGPLQVLTTEEGRLILKEKK